MHEFQRQAGQPPPQWIHYFLRRKETLSEAEKHFTGAVGQQRVPKDFLANFSIPLPPIGEQKQITKNLSYRFEKTDKLIEKIQTEFELINKLPQSYLKEVFEGEL